MTPWEEALERALKRFDRSMQELDRTIERSVRHLEHGAEAAERAAEVRTRPLHGQEHWEKLAHAGVEYAVTLREKRKLARKLRKQQLREAKRRSQPRAVGVVYLLAALFIAYLVAAVPGTPWWLVFVALGLAIPGAASAFASRALPSDTSAPQPEAKPATVSATADPQLARVDRLCDQLLAELKSAPGILKTVAGKPEEKVQALRKSCHALFEREKSLRTVLTPEEDVRLYGDRERLVQHIAGEKDAPTRGHLEAALTALDEQLRQRAELARTASRLEAERTRLSYTLETLHAQVLRARAAGLDASDAATASLRQGLERLGEEIGAVAEALESVNRDEAALLTPVSPVGDTLPSSNKGRERV